MHDTRLRGSGLHGRKRALLGLLAIVATVAAAVVAATAVPALANGGHGKGGSHSKGSSHSQKGSHGKGSSHSQKGSHGKGSGKGSSKESGKSGKSGSGGSSSGGGNSTNAHEHVTICHAAPPNQGFPAKHYVRISPSAAGVYNGHYKHHDADIIPPFTYSGQTYSLNWDSVGQAIWNNGCDTSSASSGSGHKGSGHGKGSGKSHGKGSGKGKGKGNKGGNSGNAHGHVTICHATPPDTAANGYVMISPSASGVYHGHLRQHDADIIPPFVYDGYTYSQNWDATGQAIFANGCVVPAGTTTTETTVTDTTTDTTTTTTTSSGGVAGASKSLGLGIKKLERVGATGNFARGPVAAKIGDTIFYEIIVRNTGNAKLAVTVSDPRCDAGTLVPAGAKTLKAGAMGTWFCSHVLTSSDAPAFVNVATAKGYSAAARATVSAKSRVKATVSGVAAAHKTVKHVRHRAHRAKPVTRAATFTG